MGKPTRPPPASVGIAGEVGGIDLFYMVSGQASFRGDDGEEIVLAAGDTSTHSQGRLGDPYECSHDMRLLRVFISDKVRRLRERTPEEIRRLEALGPAIVRRREVRAPGDPRPVNALWRDAEQPF